MKDFAKESGEGYSAAKCKHRKSGWCKRCIRKLEPNRHRRDIASRKIDASIQGLIYLASPYTYTGRFDGLIGWWVRLRRYNAVVAAAAKMIESRQIVFSPIAHSHVMAAKHNLKGDWAAWKKQSLPFLYACDSLGVLTLDGWAESKGVREEMEIALALGKPVSYVTMEGLGL